MSTLIYMPKSFSAPSLEDVTIYGSEIGLPESECEKFWFWHDQKSWMIGKVKISRWKSAMAVWRLKWKEGQSPERLNGAQTVLMGREYERIIDRMKVLKSTYGDAQTWCNGDKAEFIKLRERRNELRGILGLVY